MQQTLSQHLAALNQAKKVWVEQQLANLDAAKQLWAEVPPECVIEDLDKWTCGTQACFGGHLATWEYFKNLGVRAGVEGNPECIVNEERRSARAVSILLFGCELMFVVRNLHPADNHLDGATDHAIVTNRINYRTRVLKAKLQEIAISTDSYVVV